jgi:hypothetical protein
MIGVRVGGPNVVAPCSVVVTLWMERLAAPGAAIRPS